jgi:FG-GAP repeat
MGRKMHILVLRCLNHINNRTNIYIWTLLVGLCLLTPAPILAQTTFPATFDLNTLDGSNGFVIRGNSSFEQLGRFVTGVGDVNGDGIDDFALGRPRVDKGEIYFGRTGGYPSLATLQALGNSYGKSSPQDGGDPTTPGPLAGDVTIVDGSGGSSDTGRQVTVVGDLNGDGHRDFAVSQPFSPSGSQIAIGYGSAAGTPGSMFPANTDLTMLTDSEGFIISNPSNFGDVEIGFGIDTLFIGPRTLSGTSSDPASPVLFLKQSTFTPGSPPPAGVTDTSMWGTPGSPGGKIISSSLTKNSKFGFSIAVSEGTSSFTGDGKPAVAIGAPSNTFSSNTTDPGRVLVIFDIDTALPAGGSFDVDGLNGTNGFVFEGTNVQDQAGFDVEFVPDLNGDGVSDIIIGIPGHDESAAADAGMACVIYGSSSPFPALMHPSDLDGTNGTCIGGFDAGDRAGESVCGIADIDGDGKNETCIGAPNDDPDDGAGGVLTDAGGVYVIEVPSITSSGEILVSGISGPDGFFIPGLAAGDELGTDCTSPGDVNGDGAADMICGAPFASFDTDQGAGGEYVICGKTQTVAHTLEAKTDFLEFTEDTNTSGKFTGNLFDNNGTGPDVDSIVAHKSEFAVTKAAEDKVKTAATDILDNALIGIVLGVPQNSVVFNVPFREEQSNGEADITIGTDGSITVDTKFSFNPLGPNDSVTIGNPGDSSGGIAYRMTDNHGLQSDANIIFIITGVNDPPSGQPLIEDESFGGSNGHVGLGALLKAAISGIENNVFDWEGIDQSTNKFEWFDSNGTLIQENTDGFLNTALLPASGRQQLLGKSVTVRYSYTDKKGTNESVTSAPFGPFSNPRLSVVTEGLGEGNVFSSPAGIDCPPDCSAEFDFGTQVSLVITSAPGTKLVNDKAVTMNGDSTTYVRFELNNPTPTTVVSSALPSARSGQAPASGPDDPEKAGTSGSGPSRPSAAGDPITVFYTAINAGADPAQSCSVTIGSGAPVTLSFQPTDATNAPVGSPDQPFDMNAGEVKTFVLSFTPVSVTTGIEVFPNVVCDNASVSPISGVNGVFLTISDQPVPDVLSIGATVSNDGIIRIDSAGGSGFMSASALNIGVGDNGTAPDPANPTANTAVMTISADTGSASLPLVMGVCALNAQGACINPPSASVDVNVSNQAATMAVFVTATGAIALDPATNRVFLRFVGADGITRSITSAAITAP